MPPTRRKLLTGLFAALLLTGVGLGAWMLLRPQAPSLAPSAQGLQRQAIGDAGLEIDDLPTDTVRIDASLADAPDGAAARSPEPLPELVVPLARALDELRRRTGEGEPEAACRLALSLSGCARIDEHRRTATQSDEPLVERLAQARGRGRGRVENQVQYFLRRQENAQRWVEYCEGFPGIQRQEVVAALRTATELRDPISTERYLQFMMHGGGPYLLAHPGEALLHRDTVRRTVLRMLREGDHALLPWIGLMASPSLSPLFDDILPAPFRDPDIGLLAYRIASSEARDVPVQYPRGETPPADTLARAEQAYRDYFGRGEHHAAGLRRMKRTQEPGYIDQDVFDRMEGCTAE